MIIIEESRCNRNWEIESHQLRVGEWKTKIRRKNKERKKKCIIAHQYHDADDGEKVMQHYCDLIFHLSHSFFSFLSLLISTHWWSHTFFENGSFLLRHRVLQCWMQCNSSLDAVRVMLLLFFYVSKRGKNPAFLKLFQIALFFMNWYLFMIDITTRMRREMRMWCLFNQIPSQQKEWIEWKWTKGRGKRRRNEKVLNEKKNS